MVKKKGRQTVRFTFRRSGEILALAAGLALFAGIGPGHVQVQAAPVSQPEGYDSDAWSRLLDDTLEYGEIPDLIEYFNPSYRAAADSAEGNLEDSYEMAEDMREEAKEYRQQAKAMESEGDAAAAAQYKAMGKALQDAASSTEKALDSQKKKLDRYTLEPIRKQLASAAQSLFIGYNQMVKNQALLEKMAELYSDMLASSEVQSGIGMATSTDLLSAQVELTSAQNQLAALNNSIDSMRRTLILLTGWDYTDDPVIGEVPAADVSQIDAIDLEADKVTAIAYNSTLISMKNTEPASRSLKDIHARERSVEEAEDKLRSAMDALYHNLLEKRLALQAAETSYQQAKLTWEGNQRRYQLGMLGRIEYLSAQIQYIQAEAARDTANMNMVQALNDYSWAVKGVAAIE